MELELGELANVATNEKKLLKGFRVLGVFPFYLRYIRTDTHIQLCRIREKIHRIYDGEIQIENFYDSELQAKLVPLINEYCCTALVNNRTLAFLYRFLISNKLKTCGHYHILNLYITIIRLNEPAFFLSYWKLIRMKSENIRLKEVKQS